jgi:hypothetical protein
MRRILLIIALGLAPALASAHHGQDFLLVESPAVPHPGSAYLITNVDASLDGAAGSAFSPALLFGLTHRLGLELHAHVEKEVGDGWRYAALAPSVHVLLTDPERHDGIAIGVSGEYEFGSGGFADASELRLSVEKGSVRAKWAANLIAGREAGNATELSAAFAYRHQVNPMLALGLEAQRSLDHADDAELLASAYIGKTDDWALKLGVGARRLEDGDNAPVARISVVMPLR